MDNEGPRKKRKLNTSTSSPISAIAARKLRNQQAIATPITRLPNHPQFQTSVPDQIVDEHQNGAKVVSDSDSIEGVEVEDSGFEPSSREYLLEAESKPIQFRFLADSNTVKEDTEGSVSLELAPGDRLVVIGEYDLLVQTGRVNILGATLRPSKMLHRVSTPASISLPYIRCPEEDVRNAKITLRQTGDGLGSLKNLSPLFSRLFDNFKGPLGSSYKYPRPKSRRISRSSFQILFDPSDVPEKATLSPLDSPAEWNRLLKLLTESVNETRPTIMVCGPKSAGKSTFGRMLLNRLLSSATGVAILDLDPGQPEFSTPGQLSLVHIRGHNFGPPFSHPVPGAQSRIVCAHAICTNMPEDPEFYIACALDLHMRSRSLNCPLIINTCGWILGTGLDLLVELITKIQPTDTIYMTEGLYDGGRPHDTVKSLKAAAGTHKFHLLPSQTSGKGARTSADLRTMQAISYFHLNPDVKGSIAWNAQPLTDISPWQIAYSGENSGIFGIICYGEQPPADLLLDKINGSLVGVVVIDDMQAIPGWSSNIDEHITRAPTSYLPYLNAGGSGYLSPKYSHCIGLALVRGIDISKKRLLVLTPISPNIIEAINQDDKKIVLVSGKFDAPGWAYMESKEDNRPWLTKLEGSAGRGVGGQVSRVRRDLGK